MLKRLSVMLLMLVSLAACGGATATITPPPTATTAATATPRPTATTAPTATTEASTGGPEGTVPQPPNSEPYVKGNDPIVDAAISAMEVEFQNQLKTSGLNMQPLTYYVSQDTADNITAFYDDEMGNYGWDAPGQTQDQDFGKIQVFTAGASKAALIGVLDLSKAAPSLKGLIVFTTVAEQGSGGTAPQPTADTSGSSGSTDMIDIPLPPGAEAYKEGDDATLDLMVKTFQDSFKENLGDSSTLVGQAAFIYDGPFSDITKFYNDTLEAADSNWEQIDTGASTGTGNELATFTNFSDNKTLVVTSLSLKDLGLGDGMIVFVVATENK